MSYIDIELETSIIERQCPYCQEWSATHYHEWGVNLSAEEAAEFEEEGKHRGIVCDTCGYISNEEMGLRS